jgi:hypothetical protein
MEMIGRVDWSCLDVGRWTLRCAFLGFAKIPFCGLAFALVFLFCLDLGYPGFSCGGSQQFGEKRYNLQHSRMPCERKAVGIRRARLRYTDLFLGTRNLSGRSAHLVLGQDEMCCRYTQDFWTVGRFFCKPNDRAIIFHAAEK